MEINDIKVGSLLKGKRKVPSQNCYAVIKEIKEEDNQILYSLVMVNNEYKKRLYNSRSWEVGYTYEDLCTYWDLVE